MQRARLAGLAAPLIPLGSEILVLPLVGTIDGERAQHVLHTLLDGAQRTGARVILLDLTGLEHIDTGLAGTLIQVAGALGLLGAQAVLTGIRAEAAQALVSLGIELGTLVTRGTLQSGIAYARDVISRLHAGPPPPDIPARSR